MSSRKRRYKSKNQIDEDMNFKGQFNLHIILNWGFVILGGLLLIAAIPRKTAGIIDLGVFTLNVGTQLDLIRLIIGVILIYLGWRNLK